MQSFALVILMLTAISSHENKRLLLNDPELLYNELQQVQQQVQTLSSKVVELETKNNELQHVQQQMQSLASKVKELETTNGGNVYVRWGRKQCPDNDTELVYSGYAGGSYYNHKGAGTTALCLTPDPIFGNDSTYARSYIYGAEFGIDFFGPGTGHGDVPCAVCRSKSATSILMIPGRNECYHGWKKQYGGYLMTGYYDYPASYDYTCVDEHPEFIVGGSDSDLGRLFYAVTAQCGSLECPPYIQGKVITCVVCAK